LITVHYFFRIFAFLIVSFFGGYEMVNFHCSYEYWSPLVVGNIYYCWVNHEVTVSSRDEAVSISGTHGSGKNNNDVYGILVLSNVYYFPRGLEKYSKNFKVILMGKYIKEIRQADLKPFTLLRSLSLYGTIEILEDGLFDYNLDLEFINLGGNEISHIDSNVFDKLSKLSYLYLHSNTCISMNAENSLAEVQNVIRTAKAQCTNSDYSNIEQKFKNLKIEANSLNSADLAEKIKNLENEVKNSKFHIHYEEKLKNLKTIQTQKTTTAPTTTAPTTTESPQNPDICTEIAKTDTCSALNSKFVSLVTNLKDLVAQAANKTITNVQSNFTGEIPAQLEQCSVSDEHFANLTESVEKFEENYSKQAKSIDLVDAKITDLSSKFKESETNLNTAVASINESIAVFDDRLENMEITLTNLQTFTYKGIDKIEFEVKKVHAGVISTTMRKFDGIMSNVADLKSKMNKIEETLAKIMKAFKIDD